MKFVLYITTVLAVAAIVTAGGLRKFYSYRDWRLEVLAVAVCVFSAGLKLWYEWREIRKQAASDRPAPPELN